MRMTIGLRSHHACFSPIQMNLRCRPKRKSLFRNLPRLGLWLILMTMSGQALAHPHVFVTARAQIIFDDQGKITAIRNAWVFDPLYSAFVTQGLGKDGGTATREELAPLAKSNVESLAEFDYFTHAKAGGAPLVFGPPQDYTLEEQADKSVVLRFTLPLQTPASASRSFSFQIYDPTYFVAFAMAQQSPVLLDKAPSGCSTNQIDAKPLAADESKKLDEAFFSGLSPGSDFGLKLASRIIIACP